MRETFCSVSSFQVILAAHFYEDFVCNVSDSILVTEKFDMAFFSANIVCRLNRLQTIIRTLTLVTCHCHTASTCEM